ncbi:GntR family transcriptional regulator, partial [Candidatus Nomurabacteria bacterium]|nr:GntR family transcriptional regulator [Candidatus Nomurabacteria bacterium]
VVPLGKRFGANPATVVKALRVLEKRGLLEISPSSGSFVHGRPDSNTRDHTVCILGTISLSRENDRMLDRLNEFAAPYHFSLK